MLLENRTALRCTAQPLSVHLDCTYWNLLQKIPIREDNTLLSLGLSGFASAGVCSVNFLHIVAAMDWVHASDSLTL